MVAEALLPNMPFSSMIPEEMPNRGRREAPFLFVGDICFLIFALWATLFVRYGTIPDKETFVQHVVPFSLLFLLSALVFFISGLYEKHTLLFKSKLPQTIFYAQIANIVVAAVFFFLVPYFGIQPKTNLLIYLVLSTGFVSFWRIYLFPLFSLKTRASAILVGEGEECEQLFNEVNGNRRYPFRFVEFINVRGEEGDSIRARIVAHVKSGASAIVFPFSYLKSGLFTPEYKNSISPRARFIDAAELYEELFDRVALSFLDERWFMEESVKTKSTFYGFMKRFLDITVSLVGLVVLSPFLFIVTIILKLGPSGNAFIFQKRVGEGGRVIKIVKFRTMLFDDENDPERQKKNRITAFGALLRKTQIDEFPQFWNALKGDLSLIGPRPEIPALVAEYEKNIPFYSARHLLRPGISGWAQIKHVSPPKFALDIERTRQKLSYDLYYLKHRSFLLDIAIVLQTFKILLSRASR